jgi:FkbM family methyltransferase
MNDRLNRKVHEFDNGVRVYDDHLMPAQRKRYRLKNVHEADEEELFIRVIRALPADGCFINIGTAIGYYAILAKKLSPQLSVHAVEPLESFRQCFAENLRLNGLNESDFKIHPNAIGAVNGRVTFIEKGYESQLLNTNTTTMQKLARSIKDLARGVLGFIGIAKYAAGAGFVSSTDSITLASLLDNAGGKADLVSMDVQGLELEILSAARDLLEAGRIATFLIGTHSDSLHADCLDILAACEYVVEYEEARTPNQPDGIIVASKGVTRLQPLDDSNR